MTCLHTKWPPDGTRHSKIAQGSGWRQEPAKAERDHTLRQDDLRQTSMRYGLDIDPHYVDVIIRRWQQVTGKVAVLGSDGVSRCYCVRGALGQTGLASSSRQIGRSS